MLNLIVLSPVTTVLVRKDAPMVDSFPRVNVLCTNRWTRLDLPTPESPRMQIFTSWYEAIAV